MHLKSIILSSIIFSAIFSNSLRSEGELPHNHLLYQIKENECFCVEKYSGDKIYIKSENIFPTAHGLLLNLNGSDFVPLPLIQSNNQGVFLEISPIAFAKAQTKGPCPACDKNTDSNGICRNPKCEVYRFKVL